MENESWKSLKEVSEETGLSRRMIQEYEKAPTSEKYKKYGYKPLAIKPKKVDKYGHLLYGTREVERLWQLRIYHELEFSKEQIYDILEDPGYNKKKAFQEGMDKLIEKKQEIEHLINIAQTYIDMPMSVDDLIIATNDCVPADFELAWNINQAFADSDLLYNIHNSVELFLKPLYELVFETDEMKQIVEDGRKATLEIVKNSKKMTVNQKYIQDKADIVYKSIQAASLSQVPKLTFLYGILPELQNDITQRFGEDEGIYFYNALKYYCENKQEDADITDNLNIVEELGNSITNVLEVCNKNINGDLENIQKAIEKFDSEIKRFLPMLDSGIVIKAYVELFCSDYLLKLCQNETQKKFCEFVSSAFEKYYENKKY